LSDEDNMKEEDEEKQKIRCWLFSVTYNGPPIKELKSYQKI